jgi:hypothetical protein
MDPIEQMEERLRRREQEIEARELKARLKEIEQELEEIPVTPTQKHEEKAAASTPARGIFQKLGDVGKFALIVFSVIVAIRLAAWLGTAVIIMGVVWVTYKLFVENKA